MSRLPRNVLGHGCEEDLPGRTPLRAGPFSLLFEAGDLRYVRLGGREVFRRLYAAVRDCNWCTIPGVISDLRLEQRPDSFRITYLSTHRQCDIDFRWRGTIEGTAAGAIRFHLEGEAHSTFRRNRIGFCLLHPSRACAGARARIEKADGTLEEGAFPRSIAPEAPFLDLRSIAHEVSPGLWARARFEGDVFEMEDQRNWTDASFKTFSTPLSIPYPVEVSKGTKIVQSVTLELEGTPPAAAAGPAGGSAPVVVAVGTGPPLPLPRLGLGMASDGKPLAAREVARLRALNLSHLRFDLDLAAPGREADLRRAAAEAQAIGTPLEVALLLSDDGERELERLRAALGAVRPAVASWLIFHRAEKVTSPRWIGRARSALADHDARAKIGSGTNVEFVDLNRERPPPALLDFACYSLNPQVHATDNATLVENLEAQAETVESARGFLGGLPIAVTPVTLRRRFNPDSTGPEPDPEPGELPPQVDPRQMSLFGAGWTAGSLKHLAEAGVWSATYYETAGPRGVMEREAGSPLPEKFRSLPGAVFPLYHILADAGELRGGRVIPSVSSAPLEVECLAMEKDGRLRVLVANLSPRPQEVAVEGLGGAALVSTLEAANAEEAMIAPEKFRARTATAAAPPRAGGPLELVVPPFAVARIDAGPAAALVS